MRTSSNRWETLATPISSAWLFTGERWNSLSHSAIASQRSSIGARFQRPHTGQTAHNRPRPGSKARRLPISKRSSAPFLPKDAKQNMHVEYTDSRILIALPSTSRTRNPLLPERMPVLVQVLFQVRRVDIVVENLFCERLTSLRFPDVVERTPAAGEASLRFCAYFLVTHESSAIKQTTGRTPPPWSPMLSPRLVAGASGASRWCDHHKETFR